MADHPDRPDRDPSQTTPEIGEEFAETMALDLSGSGLLGEDADSPNESTMPMSADEAQAFLERMEAEKGKAPEVRTEIEDRSRMQAVLDAYEAEHGTGSRRKTLDESPDVVAEAMRHIDDKPRVSSTGRPIAQTVAERAVPVADDFKTGSLPAQGRPGRPSREETANTAPNPAVEGPNTEQLQVTDIPKTQAAARVRHPTPAPSPAPAPSAGDDSKLLVYLIAGVCVLLVLALVGIVVLVAT